MTSMKIIQFSRPSTPLVHLRPNSSILVTLDIQFQTKIPSQNNNQSIKRKHNLRMTIMLSGPSFRSPFVFNINSLILSGFLLTSFHLAEASLSTFLWLYTLVCAVAQKYHKMSFIYNYSHLQYSFYNQPVLFAQLENVNKL